MGTVSRDMIKLHPEIRFVFWDGSASSREIDLGVNISNLDHNKVHKQYFKKYLWAALHGLPYHINNEQLSCSRYDLIDEAKQVAHSLIQFHVNSEGGATEEKIYWINDYTSIALVGRVRDLDVNSTIIFSFRTPFGAKGASPKLFNEDLPIFEGLLKADIVTFHRQNDLELYCDFVGDKYKDKIISCNKMSDFETYIFMECGFTQRLIVVPMGNNREYRKEILHSLNASDISKEILARHEGKKIILSISRFEETKGIEYEIELIDRLLELYPNLRNKFVFLRYTYRSKNKVDDREYRDFHEKVMMSVEHVNSKYTNDERWVPIVYRNDKKLNDQEVTGLLSASDILLVASFADGFNHLALEAIHSQLETGNVQLILSDIGVRDYLDGYQPLSFSLDKDVGTMHAAIIRSPEEVRDNYKALEESANGLSSQKWINTILENANKIVENKKKGHV